MYPIRIEKIGAIYLPHAPDDADKIVKIAQHMASSGWTGRPVLLANCGDHVRAFTGTHRLCAAIGQDIEIDAVYLPDDLSADDWAAIELANDDDDLLVALVDIGTRRDDMQASIDVMQAECNSNAA